MPPNGCHFLVEPKNVSKSSGSVDPVVVDGLAIPRVRGAAENRAAYHTLRVRSKTEGAMKPKKSAKVEVRFFFPNAGTPADGISYLLSS